MIRLSGRNACVVATLALLITAALGAPAPRVLAEPSPRAAALSRVFQATSRRKVLEEQLVRLKTQLATKRAVAAPLAARLDTPEFSLANAPQERGKLLDQASEALRAVVTLAGKVVANMKEDLALEHEVVEIIAAAQQDANASTSDRTARGLAITRSKREYVTTLRERAKSLSPQGAEARRVRLEEVIDRYRAQGEDASALIARFDSELRFASVTPTTRDAKGKTATAGEPIKSCKMRQIDWNNVAITVSSEHLTLSEGRGTLGPVQANAQAGAAATLKQVEFLDSNLDGREEALLLVERSGRATAKSTGKTDLLYVLESALDCSLRQRAAVSLSTQGGGTGKAVRGGYEYTEQAGRLLDLRWTRGRLVPAEPAAPIAPVTASTDQ